MYCPNRNKLLQIIETMKKFLLFSKGCVVVQSYVNHVACIIDQHITEKIRQKTDYLQNL